MEPVKKILIVDDDYEFRAIVKDIFKAEGFVATDVADGIGAISEFSVSRPDVVILDYRMPTVTGIDLLRALKRMDSKVPIIMLTASNEIDLAKEACRFGISSFISKPPDFQKLILTVKNLAESN